MTSEPLYIMLMWPPLSERRTPAPAVQPDLLELGQVASCDWIKKDYMIKEVPCPLIRDAANIEFS
jgi:hypothetical protein